jgi:hypothetical protein
LPSLSKKFAVTQTFKIGQSPFFIKWLFIIHAIAILAVLTIVLTTVYKIVLVVAILVSLTVYLKKENSFKRLILRHVEVSGWEIASFENQFSSIQLLPSSVLTQYLIVLHYKIQNKKKRAIIICNDTMTNGNYRKLLVALKISGLSKDNV